MSAASTDRIPKAGGEAPATVRTLVKIAPLSGVEWGMTLGLAVVGTCWLDVWKLLGGTVRRTSAPAAPQPG